MVVDKVHGEHAAVERAHLDLVAVQEGADCNDPVRRVQHLGVLRPQEAARDQHGRLRGTIKAKAAPRWLRRVHGATWPRAADAAALLLLHAALAIPRCGCGPGSDGTTASWPRAADAAALLLLHAALAMDRAEDEHQHLLRVDEEEQSPRRTGCGAAPHWLRHCCRAGHCTRRALPRGTRTGHRARMAAAPPLQHKAPSLDQEP